MGSCSYGLYAAGFVRRRIDLASCSATPQRASEDSSHPARYARRAGDANAETAKILPDHPAADQDAQTDSTSTND